MINCIICLLTLLLSLSSSTIGKDSDFCQSPLAAQNVAVRQGYLDALKAIPGNIDTTFPLREQAMPALAPLK